MKSKEIISDKMRAIAIDWLIDVHSQFKLLPETLFLAVNIFDRYLEKAKIQKEELQLAAVGSLILACKYEEILFPEARDVEFITEGSCKKPDILQMEDKVLYTINYAMTVVTPNTLLAIFLEKLKGAYDSISCGLALPPNWEILYLLSRYILELQLLEYRMLKYQSSVLAAGSLYLAWKIVRANEPKKGILDWPDTMNKIVCRSEKEIRECAKDLYVLLQNAEKSSLQASRRKYMTEEYKKVSLIKMPDNTTKKQTQVLHKQTKENMKPISVCSFKEAR